VATLVRWEPFRELASLQSEMSRLMNGLFEGPVARPTQSWVPALDVWETDDALVYAFDLPGIPEERISIEVQDDTLTVTAEREKVAEESGDHFFRFERRYGTFSRAVGLPQGVDESKIAAGYKDGVLEITVPKPAEQKPRKIQLGTGAKADIEGTAA
jgi:HSP20 family protein